MRDLSRRARRPSSARNYRLTSESSCLYTDRVEIEAGTMALPTVLFAHLVYRRRQRALARPLAN